MKCKLCGFDLNQVEKDDVLAGLAEGIRPRVVCTDCRESEEIEEDELDDLRVEGRREGDTF